MIEKAVESGLPTFLTQGVLGVLCVILGGVIYLLWRENKNTVKFKDDEIKALNEKLVAITKEAIEGLSANSKSLSALTFATEANSRDADARFEAIKSMAGEIAPLSRSVDKNGTMLETLQQTLQTFLMHGRRA